MDFLKNNLVTFFKNLVSISSDLYLLTVNEARFPSSYIDQDKIDSSDLRHVRATTRNLKK